MNSMFCVKCFNCGHIEKIPLDSFTVKENCVYEVKCSCGSTFYLDFKKNEVKK